MKELEIWVRYDVAGNYVVSKDPDELDSAWEQEIGGGSETRTTKLILQIPEQFAVSVLSGLINEPVAVYEPTMQNEVQE